MATVSTIDSSKLENLGELLSYIEEHFKSEDQIQQVYLTPSANFSDSCEHSTQHRNTKCHINGAAYGLLGTSPLKKLIHSTDFCAAVSFYKISNFGQTLETLLREPIKKAGDIELISSAISKHLTGKLAEIKDATDEMFSSMSRGTMSHPLYGFEETADPKSITRLRSSAKKIGSRNGFVTIVKRSYDQRADVRENNTYYLIVRSYDEETSEALFEEIHKSGNNYTVSDLFKSGSKVNLLFESAKNHGRLHRDHVAYTILDIIKWSTNTNTTAATFPRTGKTIFCTTATKTLEYNVVKQIMADRPIYLYFDHCFNVSDAGKLQDSEQFWPYFSSRNGSVFFITGQILTSPKWNERMYAVPMGTRKNVHCSHHHPVKTTMGAQQLRLVRFAESQKNNSDVSQCHKIAYGYPFNFKLVENKYEVATKESLESMLGPSGVYKFNTSQYGVVEYEVQFGVFGNEFNKTFSKSLSLTDTLLLSGRDQPVILSVSDPWLKENMHGLVEFCSRQNPPVLIKDIMSQHQSGKMFEFQYGPIVSYLEKQ